MRYVGLFHFPDGVYVGVHFISKLHHFELLVVDLEICRVQCISAHRGLRTIIDSGAWRQKRERERFLFTKQIYNTSIIRQLHLTGFQKG